MEEVVKSERVDSHIVPEEGTALLEKVGKCKYICSDRTVLYIFGYGWGLCIKRGTGHSQWSEVA